MASISNNNICSKDVEKVLNKGDRISNLPDSLLVHILSFLPTKYAVGTSILSPRWKHLWASVPILHFDLRFVQDESDVGSSNFMNFVYQVFLNHELSNIQKFCLYSTRSGPDRCYFHIDISRIYTWISLAIKRGVQELDIRIEPPKEKFRLPSSFFTCPTLVVLKLGVGLSFSAVPRSVHFKSLKVLHVSIDRPNNNFALNLFRNCPVLEDLFIVGNVESEELVFDVSVPALKSFKLLLAGEEYKVLLDAPILEYLSVQNVWMPSYVLKNVTSLINADVHLGGYCAPLMDAEQHADRVLVLLRGICSVKYLSLGTRIMAALDYVDDMKLLSFPNLIRLELHFHNCYGWKCLLDLLNNMPYMVYLVLKIFKYFPYNDSVEFNFVEEVVPCYLSMHLQEIEITGFLGLSGEMRLIEYFLRNGSVLRKMVLRKKTLNSSISVEKQKREFLEKVLMIPRGSRNCEVLVS